VTGPELWAQIGDKMTHFVAGMGTGGTISGTGKYLKERNPQIQIVGVDPIGSILYDLHRGIPIEQTTAEGYKVEGIGEDFLPSTTDLSVVDAIVQVGDQESLLMTRRLVREEGMFVGGSCGAAVVGAIKYAREQKLGADDTLVVVLPDSGSRYLSKIFNDNWMRENGFLQRPRTKLRAQDIHAQKGGGELVTVTAETTMEAAIGLMKGYNVSQLPVVDEAGHLQGLVSEIDLLNHLLLDEGHDHGRGEPIAPLVNHHPVTVKANTAVADLMRLFREQSVVIISDDGQHIQGILTKIDMLDFLASTT
jgi:cystathionine beta-synthase